MTKLTDNQILDLKVWFKPEGDADFSEAHNKQIIEDSIKAYDLQRSKADKAFAESLGERADAVASLLKHIDGGKSTNSLKYFGKKELARLRGEDILGEMRLRMASMQRQNHAEKKSQN